MSDLKTQPTASEGPVIINRGRGPEIKGTRITVFDILDYTTRNWEHADIAELFRLSLHQVQEAVRYIESHTEELMPQYQEMLDRDARGNPPEIQAKLDGIVAEGRARRAAAKARQNREAETSLETAGDGNRGG
jgi:uncharacterized protein (DUF433 family)